MKLIRFTLSALSMIIGLIIGCKIGFYLTKIPWLMDKFQWVVDTLNL